jgi:hypothetical protein
MNISGVESAMMTAIATAMETAVDRAANDSWAFTIPVAMCRPPLGEATISGDVPNCH